MMNNILEVRNLCKTYLVNNRQKHVLKNIDLTIKEGEFVAVMGPSGSGKSTLLYNISGMDRMTAGEVAFAGHHFAEMTEKELSKIRLAKMGFVFQQINLLKNLGIIDNIIFSAYLAKNRSRKEINQKAIELMKKTGIIELADNDITQASGGQLQRAAICRALINDPEILFADEPTGALNSRAAEEVMTIFHNINQEGTTVMMVTHDVKVASHSEKILYMVDGNIIGEYLPGKYNRTEDDLKLREAKLANWLLDKGF